MGVARLVAVCAERQDRGGCPGGQILASGLQGRDGAGFQVGQAGFDVRQPACLCRFLGQRQRKGAPPGLDPGRHVADLLLQDGQRIAVGEVLLCRGGGSPEQGVECLEHGAAPFMNVVQQETGTVVNEVQGSS